MGRFNAIKDGLGKPLRLIGVNIDITARKRGQKALRQCTEWERLSADVIENANIPFAIAAPDGRIPHFNHAFTELTGYSREEIEGGGVTWVIDLTPPEWREKEAEALARAVANHESVRYEKEYQRKDGSRVPLELVVQPVFVEDGSVAYYWTFLTDITERKHAEERICQLNHSLEQRNADLSAADRRKDEFLGMLSHELRNPLAPIRSSLYILDRSPPGSDPARRALATIDRQVSHLTRIVGDLLDVSRMMRGTMELLRGRLDLSEVVARAIEDHRSLFADRCIELRCDEPNARLWMNADATRLTQALGNVLQNAAKFTPAGGKVFVQLRQDGPSALLSIRDTGVGISPEIMAHLFEPFTQADRTLDRTAGGLGLGLALVKQVILLHGGKVHATSEGPGLGAEITIRLPVETESPRPEQRRVGVVRTRTRRVLVIEDNVDVAEGLKEALELDDHEVTVAYTGPEGLAKARAFSPDVVLCDIGLPGMDGYDVARAFRADETLRDIALVAVTGYAGAEDKRRAASAGFDHHIAKPPNMDAIERLLAEVPDRHIS